MPTLDHQQIITSQLENIFSTMLSLPVSLVGQPAGEPPATRIAGTIGIAGPTLVGSINVILPLEFANQIVAAMLGAPPQSNAELVDVVGEITNMVAAGIKNAYSTAGISCAISVPSVIRGTTFSIINVQKARREVFWYQSGENVFEIELNTKS